jgi:ABC-2 type transport system ATP-binding protein
MQTLIETHEMTKRFGRVLAVDGVDLQVQAGEILVLLGPNGAGKTTTIRMLASILPPTSGWAKVAGMDVVQQATEVRRAIGLLSEHHGLYTRMRSREYLTFFGRVHGMEEEALRRRIEELLERFGLAEEAQRRLGEFSRGMRQKLALVRSLLHAPLVLLLDEPTSALDPASARLVRHTIKELRPARHAIVVCTHNLSEADELADRIAIIGHGRILAQDSMEGLKKTWLGKPTMELRLVSAVDGAANYLPPGLEGVSVTGNVARYQTENPQQDNPTVLEAMRQAGLPVLTLSEVKPSLEQVYLRVVQENSGREESKLD